MPFRFSTPRRWTPLSDAEWALLAPYVLRDGMPGRPISAGGARRRLDAIVRMAVTGRRWADTPPDYGKPDTVHRQLRRWTHAGLWDHLLVLLSDPDSPLRALEFWICRAYRRARRIGGTALGLRLGLLSALPKAPHQLPMPRLSESIDRAIRRLVTGPAAILANLPLLLDAHRLAQAAATGRGWPTRLLSRRRLAPDAA